MRLVLFDFDKTLTTKDSFIEFLKYAVSSNKIVMKGFLLSPWFVLFKLGLYKGDKFKKRVLSSFFYGSTNEFLLEKGRGFSYNKIPSILNTNMYSTMQKHIKDGDKVVLVSASLKLWLQPWANNHGIDLISTELHFDENIFKGDFTGENCKGPEKKKRILERYKLDNYEEVVCYGNKDDEAMLSLATSSKNRTIV